MKKQARKYGSKNAAKVQRFSSLLAALSAGLYPLTSLPAMADPGISHRPGASNSVTPGQLLQGSPAPMRYSQALHPVNITQNSGSDNGTTSINPALAASFSTFNSHKITGFIAPQTALLNQQLSAQISGSKGMSFDLGSANANLTLGSQLVKAGSVITILEGGNSKTYGIGSRVTAAEYFSIKQVLSTGAQQLVLDNSGKAVGGTMSLDNLTQHGGALRASELVIASGVTAIDDVSKNGVFKVTGSLVNHGNINLVSSGNGNNTALVSARNINNEIGGSIASFFTQNNSPINLILHSAQDFANSGSISSSGALTILTGGMFTNNSSGQISSQSGNINLGVGSGQIVNTGLIESKAGSINIFGSQQGNIDISAIGGVFRAATDINMRTVDFTGLANTNLLGGDYLSKNLNIYSGTGDIEGIVGKICGNLNTVAGLEHLSADTPNLNLGNNTISGDPIFVNSGGDISITGTNTFGENVAIIASGNVTGTNASAAIVNNGNDVLIIAGAHVISINGGSSINAIPPTTSTVSSVTVDGVSATGGNIDLSSNNASTVIDTHATVGGGNGGNVTLAALANGANTGFVRLNTVVGINSINSSGFSGGTGIAGGSGGNITIIAGGKDNANIAVSSGALQTSGGTDSSSGAVSITASQPTFDSDFEGQATIVFPGNLNSIDNSSISASSTLTPFAQIIVGNVITAGGGANRGGSGNAAFSGANGGNITMQANGGIQTGALQAYGGGGSGNPFGIAGSGGAGGNITISSITSNVTVSGDINASGGGGGGSADASGGLGGNSGNITLFAGDSVISSGPILAAGGGQGGGSPGFGLAAGGGSFGGGGGATASIVAAASGGGGYFGGGSGSTAVQTGGDGGGAFGGGQAPPLGNNGTFGQGGSESPTTGGNFGIGGGAQAPSSGHDVFDGNPANGKNGTVTITAGAITVSSTIGTHYPGSGFSSSPFAGVSIAADTIVLNSATSVTSGTLKSNTTVVNTNSAGTVASASAIDFDTIIFNGQSLALISGQGIHGNSINLSSNTGAGGNLTLIANASYTPSGEFGTITNPNISFSFNNFVSSGNIDDIAIGTIDTSGDSTGGNVTVANYGGGVSFSSIDTRGFKGSSGSIEIIAPGNIIVDGVKATTQTNGNVVVYGATPSTAPTTQVFNGALFGFFTPQAFTSSTIDVSGLNAGYVLLQNGAAGTITSVSGKTITAAVLDLQSGQAGSVGNALPIAANFVQGNITNSAILSNSTSGVLGSFSAGVLNISAPDITVKGSVKTTQAGIGAQFNLTVDSLSSISASESIYLGGADIVVNGTVTPGSGKTIALNSASNLSLSGTGSFKFSGTGSALSMSAEGIVLLDGIFLNSKFFPSGQGLSFVAVAGTDINQKTLSTQTINTSNTSNGGLISLIAGAAYSLDPSSPQTLTVTGPSATGGSITLPTTSLNSSSSTAAGGNIILAAFGKSVVDGPGVIQINDINTIGKSLGGSVTAIAGGSASALLTTLNTQNINTTSAGSSGAIQLLMSEPDVSSGLIFQNAVPQSTLVGGLDRAGNIVSNNLFAPGAGITIVGAGSVTANTIVSAGSPGVSVQGSKATSGQSGGAINISVEGNISITGDVLSYGGGGGGGFGGGGTNTPGLPGQQGGAGGAGGSILINSDDGIIQIGGSVNSSGGGGGGGGGGGATNGPAGVGGAGGAAAAITIAAAGVTVTGSIFSVGGGDGGIGGVGGPTAANGGGGGGGGGSYGGGGGGGGGGYGITSANGVGGGGGAGAFGGGGGGGGNQANKANGGGSGGSYLGGGAGGTGDPAQPATTSGLPGTAGSGGNAVSYAVSAPAGVGGVGLGNPGTGGDGGGTSSVGLPGASGTKAGLSGTADVSIVAVATGANLGATRGGQVNLQTGNSNLVFSGDISASKGISIIVDDSGTVFSANGSSLISSSVSLVSNPSGKGNGNFGTLSNRLKISNGSSPLSLQFQTSGNAYLALTGSASTVSNSSASTIILSSANPIIFDGSNNGSNVSVLTDKVTVNSGASLNGGKVLIQGITNDGTIAKGTALFLDLSGKITSTADDIYVLGAPGQDVQISGNSSGVFSANNSASINLGTQGNDLTGRYPNLELASNLQFVFGGASPAGIVNLTADSGPGSSVIIDSNVVLDFPTNNTTVFLNTNNLIVGNSNSSIDLHSATNPDSKLVFTSTTGATIANSSGPLDLGTLASLQYSTNLTILSAGDIINTGGNNLTLSLANASGRGYNLTLIAGYTFTPGTVGTAGPDTDINYTLNNSGSGSILLNSPGHLVNIDTSGTFGGGNVLLVAHGGSVQTNDISTKGGSQLSGTITAMGFGVTVNNLDTTANSLGNSGAISIESGTVSQLNGPVVISAGAVSKGSFAIAASDRGQNINTTGSINVGISSLSLTTGGAGSKITLSSTPSAHALSIDAGFGTLDISALSSSKLGVVEDANNNGGTINLAVASVISKALPLKLNASGTGSGNGGTVTYTVNSASPFTLDASVLNVNADGSNGGNFIFSTGGNLTVNPSVTLFNINPTSATGNGATLHLTAGAKSSGTLLVTGPLSLTNGASGGSGGAVYLSSNSGTAFLLNQSATAKITNGIRGLITISNGSTPFGTGLMSISNRGGGITTGTQPLTSPATVILDTSGASKGTISVGSQLGNAFTQDIQLTAGGSGTISLKSAIQANSVKLKTETGSINGIKVNTTNLFANSAASINLTNTNTNPLNLGASSATGSTSTFTLLSAGKISTTGSVVAGKSVSLKTTVSGNSISIGDKISATVAGGTVTLTTAGNGSITTVGTLPVSATNVSLLSSSGNIGTGTSQSGAVIIQASNLSATSTGSANIINTGSSPLTLKSATSASTFTLRSGAGIINNASISAATSITFDTSSDVGSIVMSKPAGGKATTDIVLSTNTGDISGTGLMTASKSLVLFSYFGSIGSSKTAMNLTAPSLTATTGSSGVVNLKNSNKTATVLNNSSAGGNFTLNASGPLTLNNISTNNGSITVITSAAGLLQTAVSSQILAAGSNSSSPSTITLENSNTSAGSILIGAGSTIATSGVGGGNTNIIIGALSKTPVPGTAPSNLPPANITESGGGKIFYGANGIKIGGTPSVVFLNAIGKNVVFNTGKLPASAITINGGSTTTITADPPIASLSLAAPVSSAAVVTSHQPFTQQSIAGGTDGDLSVPTYSIKSPLTAEMNTHSNVFAVPQMYSGTAATNTLVRQATSGGSDFSPETTRALFGAISNDESSTIIDKVQSASIAAETYSDFDLGIEGSRTIEKQTLSIHEGNFLLAPIKDLEIRIPHGTICIKAGTVVFLSNTSEMISIFDLHDTSSGSVKLHSNFGSYQLSPGMHLTLAPQFMGEFAQLNKLESISHRKMSSQNLGNGWKLHSSEFSILSTISAVEPLRTMLTTERPQAKKLLNSILKTTAVTLNMSKGKGPYQQYSRPLSAMK